MNCRLTASTAAFILAVGLTFCLTTQAQAQTCYYNCPTNETCKRVVGTADTWQCRARCYTDASCRCWTIKCWTFVPNTSRTEGCPGEDSSTLFCQTPRCDDPTLADCDDVSEHNTGTPVIIDVEGNGIRLTSAAAGVPFDLDADGIAETLAWTETGGDDAWLALDRNGNGTIDGGTELFGDATPQPAGGQRHGYRALAVFDDDGNAQIDAADAVWPLLRLWRDADHDGVSQPWELSALDTAGIRSLSLSVKTESRRDRYGNLFRYRAEVGAAKPGTVGHFSYDVILAH
jgi:hypothetical protein